MANILVVSSEYPNPHNKYDTPVVHYYVKEWIKTGNTVKVVYIRSIFPKVFYFLASKFSKVVKYIFGTDNIPYKRIDSPYIFCHEDVEVIAIPAWKIFPHFKYLNSSLEKVNNILQNKLINFNPDYVLCHFIDPQLQLVPLLRKYYIKAKFSLVIHEDPFYIKNKFGEKANILLNYFDYIGFRNKAIQNNFIKLFGNRVGLFLCPSGVPSSFVLNENAIKSKFSTDIVNICFVGMLIPYKNVDIIIESVSEYFTSRKFLLKIVGDGFIKKDLLKLTADLKIEKNVIFIEKTTRENVQKILSNSDIFIMVSEPEAFGLVYLEAMSKGCITVGTKGQGIDGVIVDSYNGFLCESKSKTKLVETLSVIDKLSYSEKLKISSNALLTAKEYSDENVAIKYLNYLK